MKIAELLFNRPLMISEAKLNSILHVMGPRFNLDVAGLPQAEAAVLSDDQRSRSGYQVKNGIAVIGIYGPLVHRININDFPSGGPTTYGAIRRAFDTALQDEGVQSIILDVDSPGGEVNGCFDLADHIFQSRSIKPISAVVNEMAYSAAYLLASAAERIYIPRTGGAGSIGVIASHADFSKYEEAEGIKITHIFAGARKADFSPHFPLSEPAAAALQESVDDTYILFSETVARHRGLSVKAVQATEAGFYIGKKAVAAGLADEVMPAAKALATVRTKGRNPISAVTHKENQTMNITELRENHPELVAQIESDARTGMVAESAVQEATAAETTRLLGLVTATMGEETGTKFGAVVASGLTAEQATTLGITVNAAGTESQADLESRAAILKGIQGVAPEGMQGIKPADAAAEARTSAVSAIAAGGSIKK
jgi:signal peptide peptidase SppA